MQTQFFIEITLPSGERRKKELKFQGSSKGLTEENVEEYVDLYINYMLYTQAKELLSEIRKGFEEVFR